MPSFSFWPWLCRNPPYEPWLIDLQAYEGALLKSKARGGTLRPPPTTPGRTDREWTLAESQVMQTNRDKAMSLYEWVNQLRIVDPSAPQTPSKRRAAQLKMLRPKSNYERVLR
jgi:hypothetical protein